MEIENPKGLLPKGNALASLDKKNLVIIIRTANDLNHLENCINKGYVVQHHQFDGKRDYWLISKPEIRLVREKPEIESARIVNLKGNENYVKETELLQKQGYKIDSVTPSSVILLKYSLKGNPTDKETEAKK